MRIARIGFLFLVLTTVLARASGVWSEVNQAYLRDAVVTEKAGVLHLSIDFPYSRRTDQPSPVTIPFYAKPKLENPISCTFHNITKPETMDCGLSPFSLGGYDSTTFTFLVKQEKGDWVEMLGDPKGKKSFWFYRKGSEQFRPSVGPLARWILGYYKFAPDVRDKKLEIFEKPDDRSKRIATCSEGNEAEPFTGAYTSIPEEVTYLDDALSEVVKGDFVRVTCDQGSKCFTEDSRNNPLGCQNDYDKEVERLMEARKKLPPCPTGWARWKSAEGKLRIYPIQLPSLCD